MQYHNPVLLHESVNALITNKDGVYVDVTFGGGGHSKYILDNLHNGKLISFDQDLDALENKLIDTRFTLVNDNFRNLQFQLNNISIFLIDGLLADLGVSSHQFDMAHRGFSIRFDADLDMRMNQNNDLTAKDVINNYDESELIRIFKNYGELFQAKRIAKAIVNKRVTNKIETVDELKKCISHLSPPAKVNTFFAQVFQALRIEVNDELSALTDLLEQLPNVIRKGGRVVVISYHSLEDRLVKNIINTGNVKGEINKDLFGNTLGLTFKAIARKAIEPSSNEIANNSRARSAKMRIAERI